MSFFIKKETQKDKWGDERTTVTFRKGRTIVTAIIAFIVLITVFKCFTSIPTGHTGVITTFGKVEHITLDAGVHLKAPWQRVIKMDNRVQKQTLELACFSSDIQEVSMIYTLNYQISKSNAMDIYANIGRNYYDTVVAPTTIEAIKIVVAKYTAENLVGDRADLARTIETDLSNKLLNYDIELVSTSIEDMDFTDAFTNAVEAKQVAAQNKLTAETQQAQKTMEQEAEAERAIIAANAKAQQDIIAAQADLEVVKIQADAALYAGEREANMNERIAAALSAELIKYYWIKQWNGELPSTVLGDSNQYIIDITE